EFQTTPKNTIVVDQIETCKQMTFNGIGYAILPAITLNESAKNMKKIPLTGGHDQRLKRDTWLLGYESAFELKQVQAFIGVVNDFLKTQPHTI
ncbi:MAG: LysR substrate-binding domain-containing protein, partial [Heyndrickxia sp.]